MLELVALPATPPSSLVRAGPTPSPKAKTQLLWTTRKPRCSDYGVARHYAFKRWGHYFCNPCDLWDALPPDTTQKSSIHWSRSACITEHTHFSHPTTLRRNDCYFRRRKRTVGIVARRVTAPPGCVSFEVQKSSGDKQEVSSESDSCVSSSFKEQNDTSRSSVLLLTEDNQSKSTTYTATTTTDTATSDEQSNSSAQSLD